MEGELPDLKRPRTDGCSENGASDAQESLSDREAGESDLELGSSSVQTTSSSSSRAQCGKAQAYMYIQTICIYAHEL